PSTSSEGRDDPGQATDSCGITRAAAGQNSIRSPVMSGEASYTPRPTIYCPGRVPLTHPTPNDEAVM
ncbi:MAG: hypothetical protein M3Q03_21675, partial [Chloroflexota bacterium]|nr:hypothetical protein [Chloroflexota bacterium]